MPSSPHFNFRRRPVLLGVLVVLLLSPPAQAQVSVAPVALFLDESNPFGTFYVSNQSGETQEVSIDTRFGYPASDSLGNVIMQYDDSTAAEQYSIGQALRIFPRQFVLPPNERQIVRITARPSSERDEGYYWTRLVTTATPQSGFVDTTAQDGVQAQVRFRLQQVTAVLYEKGDPETSVDIERLNAVADSGQVVMTARLERGGNAPFIGSARLRIYDAQGELVTQTERSLAAYFSLFRRFEVPTDALPPGQYSAELRLSPERSDVAPEHRIPMEPVSESASFTVE